MLFTAEYLGELERRHSSRPGYDQPLVYRVATSDELRDVKSELESWLRALSATDRRVLLGNLRGTDETFLEAYHELAVGAMLASFGFKLNYQARFGTLTPDWSADATCGAPPLCVEVVTVNEPAALRSTHSATNELFHRLKGIPYGGILTWCFATSDHALDRNHVPRIASEVRRWLVPSQPGTPRPAAGAELPLDNLVFRVVKCDPNSPLRCRPPAEVFYANRRRLREAIAEKIKKYGDTALKERIALLIAVVADPLSGLSADSLVDVLFGSEVVKVSCDEPADELAEVPTFRVPDGLFRNASKALSGVLWVEGTAGRWRMDVVLNPEAANPIPVGVFDAPVDRSTGKPGSGFRS